MDQNANVMIFTRRMVDENNQNEQNGLENRAFYNAPGTSASYYAGNSSAPVNQQNRIKQNGTGSNNSTWQFPSSSHFKSHEEYANFLSRGGTRRLVPTITFVDMFQEEPEIDLYEEQKLSGSMNNYREELEMKRGMEQPGPSHRLQNHVNYYTPSTSKIQSYSWNINSQQHNAWGQQLKPEAMDISNTANFDGFDAARVLCEMKNNSVKRAREPIDNVLDLSMPQYEKDEGNIRSEVLLKKYKINNQKEDYDSCFFEDSEG